MHKRDALDAVPCQFREPRYDLGPVRAVLNQEGEFSKVHALLCHRAGYMGPDMCTANAVDSEGRMDVQSSSSSMDRFSWPVRHVHERSLCNQLLTNLQDEWSSLSIFLRSSLLVMHFDTLVVREREERQHGGEAADSVA